MGIGYKLTEYEEDKINDILLSKQITNIRYTVMQLMNLMGYVLWKDSDYMKPEFYREDEFEKRVIIDFRKEIIKKTDKGTIESMIKL